MWVTNSRPREFPVRTDFYQRTSHEVVIECCTDGNRRRTCPEGRLVRAVAESESVGMVGSGEHAEGTSGPSASGPPIRPLPLLGPRMVVVD